jgi:endo-1,4-beta-xylanase
MKNKLILCLPVIFLIVLSSCSKKNDKDIANPGFVTATDTAGPLKSLTDLTLGVAIDYNPAIDNTTYINTVKKEFDAVTFSYNMKHGAIVQDNGVLNFTAADAMMNAAGTLEVFGHTLAWHENQNAGYLKNFSGINGSGTGPEALQNTGFESGNATSFLNWNTYNSGNPAGAATISVGSGAAEVRTGTRSMKVVNTTANPTEQWRVQVAGDLIPTKIGKEYAVSYWVKAASAGGAIRLSTQTNTGGSPQYQGDQSIGTDWQEVKWTITANSTETRILFDMGQAAKTYYIDDASFKELGAGVATDAEIAGKLDVALNDYITKMVTHFKGKVKAWDVVNELFDNGGNIRNNANTPNSNKANDFFVWSGYLGRDLGLKAFNYAKAADPAALLFINDYGLESSIAKLDSLIKYVAELKGKGAKVDGIGTQMHINATTNFAGIDAMMQKLGATGLRIRISELDVRVNPDLRGGYILTPFEAFGQQEMYKYVIQSYLKYIPAAQRYGITVWGLTDNTSWLYNNGKDFPLLFNENFSKKPAYGGVVSALKAQ